MRKLSGEHLCVCIGILTGKAAHALHYTHESSEPKASDAHAPRTRKARVPRTSKPTSKPHMPARLAQASLEFPRVFPRASLTAARL
jgi:hypothetical protein